jgi:mRNA interferase MazF
VPGSYGKTRPALVVQSDFFDEHPSVTILPITSELRSAPLFRIPLEPTSVNGLKQTSHIMVDKIQTISVEKVGEHIGLLEDKYMLQVNRSLALFLGFA